MTTSTADLVGFACRLDPLYTDGIPAGTEQFTGAGERPYVALDLPTAVAAALEDAEPGSYDVTDARTGADWTIWVAPSVAAVRFTAAPTQSGESSTATTPTGVTAAPMIGLSPTKETADETTEVPEVPEVFPDVPAGAAGLIGGVLWNGNHTPLPAGTVTYGGQIMLALDADQFQLLSAEDIDGDEEHRGIIDRHTGARWTVTHHAGWRSGADRYRFAPQTASTDGAQPQPGAEDDFVGIEGQPDRIRWWTSTDPGGLGAVVEDLFGHVYVRHCPGDCPDKGACIPWSLVGWGTTHTWDAVTAGEGVKVHWRGIFGLAIEPDRARPPAGDASAAPKEAPEAPMEIADVAQDLAAVAARLAAAVQTPRNRS